MKRLLLVLTLTAIAVAQQWDTVYNVPNYANGKRPLPVWRDYTHYMGGNWSALRAHTVLGDTMHIIYEGGNVKNCDAGVNAEFRNCYQGGNHVDYCFWEHPEWPLDSEDVWCRHVIPESSVVLIDTSVSPPDTYATEIVRKDRRVP